MVDDLVTHGCQTGNNGSDDRDGSDGDEWEEKQNPCNVTVAVLAKDAQQVGPESHICDLNQNKNGVHEESHAEKAHNDANSGENEKDECWGAELLNILKNCHYVVGWDFIPLTLHFLPRGSRAIRAAIPSAAPRNGMITRNQERVVYPVSHKEFRTMVQKATLTALITNIRVVLGTLHEYSPTQYSCSLPRFWPIITAMVTTEITR